MIHTSSKNFWISNKMELSGKQRKFQTPLNNYQRKYISYKQRWIAGIEIRAGDRWKPVASGEKDLGEKNH